MKFSAMFRVFFVKLCGLLIATMHRFIFILTILSLFNCNYQSKKTAFSKTQPNTSKNKSTNCFSDIDTTKNGMTISCSGGIYKLINNKFVVHILPDFPVKFDSCYTITIDSSNAEKLTELLIFDSKNANLTNTCTDLIKLHNPNPSRTLHAESGQLIVRFSDPTELYGNRTYHTTILIKRLIFYDYKTRKKIELKNELLWKVLNTGTPG